MRIGWVNNILTFYSCFHKYQLGIAGMPVEPILLTSTLLIGLCCYINLTVVTSFRVGLLFAWLCLCMDLPKCAQRQALAHTNRPTVAKKS